MLTTVVDATRSLTQTLSLTPLPLLGSACLALSSRDRDTRHYPDYTLLHNSWRTALPADYKQEYRSSLLLLLLLLHLWNERSETPKRSRTVEVGLFLISRGWEHSTRNPEGASRLRGMNVPHLLETTTPQTPTNSWDLRYFSLSFATKWFQSISS